MEVKVSIGLCVRNAQKTIKTTLECLKRQNFPLGLMEIIVVDDGSSDNTMKIARDVLSKTPIQVKFLSTNGEGRLGKARQLALDNANGRYILWIDGDVETAAKYVQQQVDFMDTHPSVGKARGNWAQYDGQSLVAFLESMQALQGNSEATPRARSAFTGIGASICRVAALRQTGGFDENIIGSGEDIDMAIKLRANGWSIAESGAREFFHPFRDTWKGLWAQYFWYGHGGHYLYHKHGNLLPLWHRLPLVAFFLGIRRSLIVHKTAKRKRVFLLPLQYTFKAFAWCAGFCRSHKDGYSPPKEGGKNAGIE